MLYTHAREREAEAFKRQDQLHGAKIKEAPKVQQVDDYDGDPESLKHLSEAERQKRTDDLMAKHMQVFKGGTLG